MYIAIFYFLAKTIDLLGTNLLIASGGYETNPLWYYIINNFGEYGIVFFHFASATVIFFVYQFCKSIKFAKELLWFFVSCSFIVALYNIVLFLFT